MNHLVELEFQEADINRWHMLLKKCTFCQEFLVTDLNDISILCNYNFY
jgi:hypothetical protein